MIQKHNLSFWEFLTSTTTLTIAIAGINCSNKLIICSIFMVLSLGISLLTQIKYGRKNALSILIASVTLHTLIMIFMGHHIYLYSFIPFGCACFASGIRFEKLYTSQKYSVPMMIFLSLVSGILVDGLLIAPWEGFHFGFDKLPNIVFRSFSFKTLYAGLLSVLIFCVYDFKAGHVRFFQNLKDL